MVYTYIGYILQLLSKTSSLEYFSCHWPGSLLCFVVNVRKGTSLRFEILEFFTYIFVKDWLLSLGFFTQRKRIYKPFNIFDCKKFPFAYARGDLTEYDILGLCYSRNTWKHHIPRIPPRTLRQGKHETCVMYQCQPRHCKLFLR